eukprot:m.390353 g.390353  ORF g.390353 m.390353 type:complete len:90 (+) comp21057_c1_seq1:1477-1746(+)
MVASTTALWLNFRHSCKIKIKYLPTVFQNALCNGVIVRLRPVPCTAYGKAYFSTDVVVHGLSSHKGNYEVDIWLKWWVFGYECERKAVS